MVHPFCAVVTGVSPNPAKPSSTPCTRAQPVAYSNQPLVPLLSPVVCRHMFLAFRGGLTDSLFVARLEHLAAARVAFIKQLRKEVAIPVLVEDQFALGR